MTGLVLMTTHSIQVLIGQPESFVGVLVDKLGNLDVTKVDFYRSGVELYALVCSIADDFTAL